MSYIRECITCAAELKGPTKNFLALVLTLSCPLTLPASTFSFPAKGRKDVHQKSVWGNCRRVQRSLSRSESLCFSRNKKRKRPKIDFSNVSFFSFFSLFRFSLCLLKIGCELSLSLSFTSFSSSSSCAAARRRLHPLSLRCMQAPSGRY